MFAKELILKGIGASRGVSKGKVKIVLSPDENDKVNEGDVLVTVMTNPLFTPVMGKAKAIITDVGGLLCHAAIVARELGIPCVVGTKKATKVLKDDMEVIVDGSKGLIYLADK